MNQAQIKEWEGEEIVSFVNVGLTKRQFEWLEVQVADYKLGPIPEFLDEASVIREIVHIMMQRDFEEADSSCQPR